MGVEEIFAGMYQSLLAALPNLAGALVVLAVGIVIGLVLGKITRRILTKFKVDEYVFKGKKPIMKVSFVLSKAVSWFIYLIFIQAAVEVLGMPALVTAVGSILAFIPGVIGAVIVIFAGYIIAEYLKDQIMESSLMYSDIFGRAMFFFIVYIAVAIALPLIGLDPTLINNILLIIIGSLGLGAAIAIGLGLKDTVDEIAKKYRSGKKAGI